MAGTPRQMNERTEREFRAEMARLRDAIGADAFGKLALEFALANEAALRESAAPDNPALALLDEYHARQKQSQ